MKRRINKKGFTIVELLAVVVIIGVIGTIAIVGVNSVIKRSHEKYHLAQAKLFVAAAQTYFSDHKSRLPVRTFTQTTVTLNELIEENYIDQIVDYKKEPYDVYKSYASATKMGAGQYAYDGELITKDGERAKYKEHKNSNGSIIFKNEGSTLTSELYTNNEKEIEIVMSDSDTIAGYIVSIYKNNKKVEDLEYKEIGNSTSASTKVKLSKNIYKDGKYKIRVKLIDIYNNPKEAYSNYITLDTIAPKCSITLDGKKGENNWYISDIVTLKMSIEDNDENLTSCLSSNKNCISDKYSNKNNSKTILLDYKSNNDNINYYGVSVDRAGNHGSCNVNFKKDSKEPTLYLKKYTLGLYPKEIQDEMINEPFYIKIGYSVGPSGVKQIVDTANPTTPLLSDTDESGNYYIGRTFENDGYDTLTYQITNNAGKVAQSSINVHKETEKPKIYFSNKKDQANITISCEHPRIVGNTRLVFDDISLRYRYANTSEWIDVTFANGLPDKNGNLKYQFPALENTVVSFRATCSLQTYTGWTASAYKNTDWEASRYYYCYKTNHVDKITNPDYINCLTYTNCYSNNRTCCKTFGSELGRTDYECSQIRKEQETN